MLKRKIGVRLNSSDTNVYGQTSPKKSNVLVNFVLTVAFVWLVVGAATAAAAAESDPGVVNFEMHCATCHAQNGSGDTPVGKSVKIPDLRSPEVQSQPDAQLVEIIANGKGAMPPFKSSLSKDQIDALVKHVHQLAKTK